MLLLQLCDLKDNTIVAQLSLSPLADKCTEADGWFTPGTLAEVCARPTATTYAVFCVEC